jgi:hypothetical protein
VTDHEAERRRADVIVGIVTHKVRHGEDMGFLFFWCISKFPLAFSLALPRLKGVLSDELHEEYDRQLVLSALLDDE